jgi:replicative DNA helicase
MTAQPDQGEFSQLPNNIQAEQALLGAIFIDNRAFLSVSGFLKPEHFHEELHRRIFDITATMINQGQVATPITVKTFLGDHSLGEGQMTTGRYLARLASEAVTVMQAGDFGRMILDLHNRRLMINVAETLRAHAQDSPVGEPVSNILDSAESALFEIRAGLGVTSAERGTAGDMAADLIASIKRRQAGEEPDMAVSTGLPDLDRATGGGFHPGTLWVLAGRPGMGKTVMCTSLARAAARRHRDRDATGVVLFSLEVPKQQLMARIMADLSYVQRKPLSFGSIIAGNLDDEDMWRIEDAQKRLAVMPLVLDVSSSLSVAQIRSRVRLEKDRMARHGIRLGVVLIDYLKQVSASERYRGQRVYEVGEITAGLRQIAKDEGLCVVLLAQLNRGVEGRDDKRPSLSDLRESGDLEADADVVALLYRHAYYLEKSPEFRRNDPETMQALIDAKHSLEFIIGKNRAGPTHTLELWCDIGCSVVSTHARGGG